MIPTSTDVSISVKETVPANSEAVIVFVTQDGKSVPPLSEPERAAFDRLVAARAIRGKAKEITVDVVPTGGGKFRRLIVAGIGKRDKASPEYIRQGAGSALKALKKHRLNRAAV